MRKIDCKRMTRMMSLYVAGDLVGEPEREAAAHLADCQACRQLAEEFSESSSLLTQAFAPPEFGAEFYTGIRRAVLGKITADRISSPGPLFGQWGRWGRRWLYAGALAAVVVAAVTLLLVRAIPREPSRELAGTPQVTHPPTTDQGHEANSATSRELSGLPLKPDRAAEQGQRPHQLIALTNSRRRGSQIEAARKADAPDTVRTAREIRMEIAPTKSVADPALESVTSSGRSASSRARIASSSEISRIEMQTVDPNIRIIWLAPRDSREPEQLNHNQDPEMGDRN